MRGRFALQRVRVSVEPAGSFGVDRTGTIANFADLRFNIATLAPNTTIVNDEAVRQRLHQHRIKQHGFRRGTLDISGDLVPLGTAYAPGSTPAQDTLSKVLESMLACTAIRGAGGTVQASPSPTTTGFSVALGEGAEFTQGTMILVETASSSGLYELTAIDTISTDAITLDVALSFTPAAGCKVLNAETVYLGTAAVGSQTSLQFLVERENRGDIFALMGCQGPLSIEWPLGGRPRWSAQLQGAERVHDDELGTPQGGSALAAATLTGGTPVLCTAGGIVLTPYSGTTRTLPTIAEIAFNIGAAWTMVDSYNGVEGWAQPVFTPGEQPTVNTTVLASAEEWFDAFHARTQYKLLAQAGNTPAGAVGIFCPQLELIAEPVEIDRGGVTHTQLVFGAVGDGDVSPFSIARF